MKTSEKEIRKLIREEWTDLRGRKFKDKETAGKIRTAILNAREIKDLVGDLLDDDAFYSLRRLEIALENL
tara:strand:- start:703 stop:912 length:210 start_codon:yes stop_codon:yes gene_type:complete